MPSKMPRKPISRGPIPPDVLHDKIKTLLPDMEIKESSIWVAIIHHNDDPRDIQFSKLTWIKAHPLITLRTLKYHYYSRNPLDELALQYCREVPDERLSLRDIRPKHPRDNLMVFRALEIENVTDPKLRAGIQYNDEHSFMAQGRNPETAIDIDSSDDEPVDSSSPLLNEASMVLNDNLTLNDPAFLMDQRASGGARAASEAVLGGRNGTNASNNLIDVKVPFKTLTEIAQEPSPPPQSASQGKYGIDFKVSTAHNNDSPSAEANAAYEQHMSSPPPQAAVSSPRSHQPEPITPGRATALDSPYTAAVSNTTPGYPPAIHPVPARKEYRCAVAMCKSRLQHNKWTHIENRRPFCIGHSISFYRSRNQIHKAQEADEWIQRNAREKDFWRARGYAQWKSEDFLVNKPAGIAADFSSLDSKSSMASPTERKSFEKGYAPLAGEASMHDGPGQEFSSSNVDTEAVSLNAESSNDSNIGQQPTQQPAVPNIHSQGDTSQDVAGAPSSDMMQGSFVDHKGEVPTTVARGWNIEEVAPPFNDYALPLDTAGQHGLPKSMSPTGNRFAHGGQHVTPPELPINQNQPVTTTMAGSQNSQNVRPAQFDHPYWDFGQDQPVPTGIARHPCGQDMGQAMGPSSDVLQPGSDRASFQQMARAQSHPAFNQQHQPHAGRSDAKNTQTQIGSRMNMSLAHFRADPGMHPTAYTGHNASFADFKKAPDGAAVHSGQIGANMGHFSGHPEANTDVGSTASGHMSTVYSQPTMHLEYKNSQNSGQRGMAATPQWIINNLGNDSYQIGANTRGTQRGPASSERWQVTVDHASPSGTRLTDAQRLEQQAMFRSLEGRFGGNSTTHSAFPAGQARLPSPASWYGVPTPPGATVWAQNARDPYMCPADLEPPYLQGGHMADYNAALQRMPPMQPYVGNEYGNWADQGSTNSEDFGTAQEWSEPSSVQAFQGSEAAAEHSEQQEAVLHEQQEAVSHEQQDVKQGSNGKRLADIVKDAGSHKKLRLDKYEADDEASMYTGLPEDAAAQDDSEDGDYVDNGGENDDDDE